MYLRDKGEVQSNRNNLQPIAIALSSLIHSYCTMILITNEINCASIYCVSL